MLQKLGGKTFIFFLSLFVRETKWVTCVEEKPFRSICPEEERDLVLNGKNRFTALLEQVVAQVLVALQGHLRRVLG